ncbi:hypothetical protein [Sediminitomix flava]|uniref:Uncharacterized protein n=1 Tax=Sediminitomix flava TaxID=379075 RepID=A0A315YVK3_SEDFL|nr:hypothetical protein [Sediminitomix flava]PWJ32902.1 hypothetical protein BC781_1171 [Sediminitomix flava]
MIEREDFIEFLFSIFSAITPQQAVFFLTLFIIKEIFTLWKFRHFVHSENMYVINNFLDNFRTIRGIVIILVVAVLIGFFVNFLFSTLISDNEILYYSIVFQILILLLLNDLTIIVVTPTGLITRYTSLNHFEIESLEITGESLKIGSSSDQELDLKFSKERQTEVNLLLSKLNLELEKIKKGR